MSSHTIASGSEKYTASWETREKVCLELPGWGTWLGKSGVAFVPEKKHGKSGTEQG